MNAAKALRTAQSSLSAQIKTLEGSLGLSLFNKVGRRLVLTTDGERVYEFCKRMFETAEELSSYLKNSNTSIARRCRIGVTPEIERPFIADALSSLIRKSSAHPEQATLLSMTSDSHSVLLERLRAGEIDVAVTHHPTYIPQIKTIAEISMPVVAVAAPRILKKLLLNKSAQLSKLIKTSKIGLVLPSDRLKIRIETDLYIQKSRITANAVFESDILAVVVRAALEGAGIAFLPEPYIAKELKQETLIRLGEDTVLWHHKIYIITRSTKVLDPIVEEVKNHFIRLDEKLRPQKT